MTLFCESHQELVGTWGLESYQSRGIDALHGCARGILVSGAGSGKTIMAARAFEAVVRTEPSELLPVKLLWLANTREQVEQAQRALKMAIPPGHFLREHIAKGTEICCYASAMALDLESFDHVIVDEVHHAAADQLAQILTRCKSARRIWGMTATPHREDGQWPEVEALIGPIVARVEASEVRETGRTVNALVKFRTTGRQDEFLDTCQREADEKLPELWAKMGLRRRDVQNAAQRALMAKWERDGCQLDLTGKSEAIGRVRKEADEDLRAEQVARLIQQSMMQHAIASNKDRNADIAQVCRRAELAGHSVLCLVYSVEQGREIQQQLPGSRLVFSKMTVKQDGRREEIIADFREGRLKVLIATSLADEGFDAPRASVLVMGCSGRGISKVRDNEGNAVQTSKLEQRTARVLRSFDGKHEGIVIDYFDWTHPFAESASWSRMKGYRMLGFKVSLPDEMVPRRKRENNAPDMFQEVV